MNKESKNNEATPLTSNVATSRKKAPETMVRNLTDKETKNNEIIPYNSVKWYGCGTVAYYINNHAANILFNIGVMT